MVGSNRFRGIVAAILWLTAASAALAQSFGPELQNTMMPASGGMGGVSIARPQDLLSAINANPATLTNYKGTEFIAGAGWAEPSLHINQTGSLPLASVTPFSAKSKTLGSALANLGASQQVDLLGIDSTFGLGLVSTAGGGTDFRGVPASNGTSSQMLILETNLAAGFKLTDRLSLGGSMQVGSGFFDGPFVGVGAMVPAYALRGSVGVNYDLTDATTLGLYYQTRQHFNFQQAVQLQLAPGMLDISRNVYMDLPQTVGFGVANRRLLDGNLLLGMDVLFKNWQNADLFSTIYRKQWVVQLGSQYSYERWRLRAGYVWAEDPLKSPSSVTVGGITLPGGIPAVDYLAAQMGIINQHRISCGVGMVDIMPGIDFDLFAGGMFHASQQIGPLTSVSLASYWVGLGLTWRPGTGRLETRPSK
jgi:long-chain fatty acid transport protein